MLYDEHNEILKIGFLHDSIPNKYGEMPTVVPARIRKTDPANPGVLVDCRSDFYVEGTAGDVMSNKGCADVHITLSKMLPNGNALSSGKAKYAKGTGLPSESRNKTVHQLLKDANKQNIDSQLALAEYYRTGQNNVERDEEGALYWYTKVAKMKPTSKQAQIGVAAKWMNIVMCRQRHLSEKKRLGAINDLPFARDVFEEGINPLFNGVENFNVLKKAIEKMIDFYESDSSSVMDKKWLCENLKNQLQKVGIATRELIIDGFCDFYRKAQNWEDRKVILEILKELCNHKKLYIHKAALKGICSIATMTSNDEYKWFDDDNFYEILTPLLERLPTYQNENIRRVKIEGKISRYKSLYTNRREEKKLCKEIRYLLKDNSNDYNHDHSYAVECFKTIKLSESKKRRLYRHVLCPLLRHQQSEIRLTASLILRTFYDESSRSFYLIPDKENVVESLRRYLTSENEKIRWGAAQSLSLLYNDEFLEKEKIESFVSSSDEKLRDTGIWLMLEKSDTSLTDILDIYISYDLSKKVQSILAQKLADLCEMDNDVKVDLIEKIISYCEKNKEAKKTIKYLGSIYDLYEGQDKESFIYAIFPFFNKDDMSEWTLKCLGELYQREGDLATRKKIIKELKLLNNRDNPFSINASNALKTLLRIKGLWFYDKCLIGQVV